MKRYTKDQIDRIGNAIIYFAEKLKGVSKTKLLKLLYLTEECSVLAYRRPMFGVDFNVWQFGPVAPEVYVDLTEGGIMFADYITIKASNGAAIVKPKRAFCDDEFSDNDIAVLDYVAKKYGKYSADDLKDHTHKEGSLWFVNAEKNDLLESFDKHTKTSSEVVIDLSELLDKCDQDFYFDCVEATRIAAELQ